MNLDRKYIDKSFVTQHDSTDCGAACLLMILRYYGGDSSITHIREISGTSNTGTTLLGLCQAAKTMGFEAEGVKYYNTTELKNYRKPCVLSVIIDKFLQHYVVCFGFEKGKFIIGDPAKGVVELSEVDLSDIFTLYGLTLEPTDGFERKESIREKKKDGYSD